MALNQSDPAYSRAMTHYLGGQWDAARTAFLKLSEQYPDDTFVLLLLGNIHYSLGDLEEAVSTYNRATSINREFGIAYYKLGVCHYRMGRLERALEAFNAVIEMKSQSHAMASYFVGLINLFLGRDHDAEVAFERFRSQSKESLIANFYIAQLKIKQKQFSEALPLLEELVTENSGFAEVHYMLGVVQYGLHNNTEAIKSFRRALEINPADERSKTKLTLLTDVQWP